MYLVSRLQHDDYGLVILIERTESNLATPFQAVNAALKERQLCLNEGAKKVRILVDEQLMSPKQARHWANAEYTSLPKCFGCANILNGDIQTHQLFSNRFFCSTNCCNNDYLEEVEKYKDEEEIDYL